MKIKRKIEVAVISDVHLGTYSCQTKHLVAYLDSIKPKKLILNGDIIDGYPFKKPYFNKAHIKVLKKVMDMATNGTEVIYITGNHDAFLRKFNGTRIGTIAIVNKLVLNLDGKKAWFFHGDVLDASVKYAKRFVTFGVLSYGLLTLINSINNWCLEKCGKEPYSLASKVKNSAKNGAQLITDYKQIIADLAIKKGYDYVVCGHIHQPKIEYIETKNGKTMYLNSGDWVENFTALEYQFKRWKLYNYSKNKLLDLKNEPFKEFIAAVTVVKT